MSLDRAASDRSGRTRAAAPSPASDAVRGRTARRRPDQTAGPPRGRLMGREPSESSTASSAWRVQGEDRLGRVGDIAAEGDLAGPAAARDAPRRRRGRPHQTSGPGHRHRRTSPSGSSSDPVQHPAGPVIQNCGQPSTSPVARLIKMTRTAGPAPWSAFSARQQRSHVRPLVCVIDQDQRRVTTRPDSRHRVSAAATAEPPGNPRLGPDQGELGYQPGLADARRAGHHHQRLPGCPTTALARPGHPSGPGTAPLPYW